ncbi:uncharacterized protein BDZ99DRAFT_434980 [Mytilinidion resinicola]|uniref:VPS9 domain-containing protein n=1 Tax=Mytilinidion resinicola TaxID=574789 RepID=A0A6A6Z1E0_9PEZI|nr:uncharacterized protein BDZ99DRAFT_434980 [Mytilinidion resinicola]KAF2814976.1 hypothetical protein BDZ99DRAFT_434980 [Mytilinidion resinicola]
MASRPPEKGVDQQHPKVLHPSKSFSRLEPSKSPLSRSRASTLQGPPVPDILFPQDVVMSPQAEDGEEKKDIFASKDDNESVDGELDEQDAPHIKLPDTFEELPIEIRSLTERFLESLSAKVHPAPLSIDALSDLYQDFYSRASSHIGTHIATLISRLSREQSTPPSAGKGSKPASISSRKGTDQPSAGEQQMLTPSEISDRKKARRILELKRGALEEAVERAVCEKLYDRIWRHRSTDDEERDQKLRSRTAALSLVGIGLKELLVNTDEVTEDIKERTTEKELEIKEWLSAARIDIQKMDNEKYPLGKLQHLTAAHKSIVEALSKIFPATSSADEILPTLIYSLITSPPATINVISNLNFIQRFRGSSKMDGEAAYCLVNLEAAISFLETVDLSSLRANEGPEGPGKSNSRPTTPRTEMTPMKLGLSPVESPPIRPSISGVTASSSDLSGSPTTTKSQRRLSNLIQSQTTRIEQASDAVRESIIDSADQALDSINSTLENSFRFIFGRLKEKGAAPGQPEPSLPKTLEEARKLVSSPTLPDDDNASVSATSSIAEQADETPEEKPDLNSKMADIFGGRRPIRDRSVDSTKSGGSNNGKRVAFTEGKAASPTPPKPDQGSTTTPPAGNAAVESMRNLGNTLNPLSRFPNMNMIPRFGRVNTPPVVPPAAGDKGKQLSTPPLSSSSEDLSKEARAITALDVLRKTTPPVKRFLELKDVKELKIGEIEELLKEYQRLAGALRAAINS